MATKRSIRGIWDQFLSKSQSPLFLVDAKLTLIGFNAGCEQLTGWNSSDVVGQPCRYLTDCVPNSVHSLAASLCPPPDVFQGGEVRIPIFLERKHASPLPLVVSFLPLRDTQLRVTAVLGTLSATAPPPPESLPSPLLRLHAELAALRNQLRQRFGEESLVHKCSAMQRVVNQVELAAQTLTSVYLHGEEGTGREHLARLIHLTSPLREHWFIPLDCRKLLPSELTGILERLMTVHDPRGQGGVGPQPGTIYLAEIEFLPRDLQSQLARFLEAGSSHRQHSSVRWIASGTRPLSTAVVTETVREDLAAILGTLTIEIPPLRSRVEDIPLLAQHFVEEQNRVLERPLSGVSPEVLELLQTYPFHRNLDELQHLIHEAAQTAEGLIRPQDLPFRFRLVRDAQIVPPPSEFPPLPLEELLARQEVDLIRLALERCQQNKSKAAEMLQIPRARLYRRIEQLGLLPPSTEAGAQLD